ncbi:MAG: hypothetical protein K9L94_00690 [Candidatus Omnitrophica bacterium]|nr:hypothetical protein [Candidatus Omnitrophota bacterium]
MLIIVMHNNKEYLEELEQLAKKAKIEDFLIARTKSLGILLKGLTSDVIFSQSSKINIFNKSFLALVKNQKKAKHFLNMVKSDGYLQRVNRGQKGFIYVVPFNYIRSLQTKKII